MYEQFREHIEKIVPLTDAEFEFIRSHFSEKKYKKHQFLVQEGQLVSYAYFVISGLLKLVYAEPSGKEHIVSFAMEDWWETDYQAFHSGAPATMSLDCLEDTEVLCLSLDNYKKLCVEMHKMEHFFLEKANRGHIGSQQRILSLLTSTAAERYNQLQQKHPSLLQRVPKTILAAYLGVSRETLSRLSS